MIADGFVVGTANMIVEQGLKRHPGMAPLPRTQWTAHGSIHGERERRTAEAAIIGLGPLKVRRRSFRIVLGDYLRHPPRARIKTVTVNDSTLSTTDALPLRQLNHGAASCGARERDDLG